MNEEFIKEYEAAKERRENTELRKVSLNPKAAYLMEKIEAVKPGNYDMSFGEAIMIARIYDNNAINACHDFFKYGFLKGQRAAIAEMKKERKNHEKNIL